MRDNIKHAGGNVVAFSSPIEICMDIGISALPQRKANWFQEQLHCTLSNGVNHTSVAASVLKL